MEYFGQQKDFLLKFNYHKIRAKLEELSEDFVERQAVGIEGTALLKIIKTLDIAFVTVFSIEISDDFTLQILAFKQRALMYQLLSFKCGKGIHKSII
jgi:hypothetical protein